MSIESWKQEFFFDKDTITYDEALDAAIRKWTGLLPENLEKHGITYDGDCLFDGEQYLDVGGCNDCPLCLCDHIEKVVKTQPVLTCYQCPLDIIHENCLMTGSAYYKVNAEGAPVSVMIEALERAKANYVRTQNRE